MTNRTDNFNRADTTSNIGTPSDAGSAWSQLNGTWGISSNQAYTSAAVTFSAAVLEASASDGDVQFTSSVSGGAQGIIARAADNSNYLMAIYSTGVGYRMYKNVTGYTQIGSTVGGTSSNGDTWVFSVSGTSLTFKVNGSTVISATDSANQTNTKHGLYNYSDTTQRFDDFSFTGTGGGSVLASSGAGAASFTGASTAVSALSAPGAATASWTGAAQANSVLAGAGDSSTSWTGAAQTNAVLSAPGAATTAWTGATGGNALAAVGDSSAILVGAALGNSVLAAAGDSSANLISPVITPTQPATGSGGGGRYYGYVPEIYEIKKEIKAIVAKKKRIEKRIEQTPNRVDFGSLIEQLNLIQKRLNELMVLYHEAIEYATRIEQTEFEDFMEFLADRL